MNAQFTDSVVQGSPSELRNSGPVGFWSISRFVISIAAGVR
jgi:hypothetical protein